MTWSFSLPDTQHPQHSTGSCHVCALAHLVRQTTEIERLHAEIEHLQNLLPKEVT